VNHIPYQEADGAEILTERSANNDNDNNEDTTRREDHHKSHLCQERNDNFHEKMKKSTKKIQQLANVTIVAGSRIIILSTNMVICMN
jgi:Skp family chaperone for outer membrane proteins